MNRSILSGLLAAVLCATCGDSSSPTAPTSETRSTLIFAGTLAAGDSQFYSFTVLAAGTTEVTLASIRPSGATRSALTTTIGLGIGTPAGEGCRMSTSLNAQAGLSAQVRSQTAATIFCVNIYDVGTIKDPVDFTVRIVHP